MTFTKGAGLEHLFATIYSLEQGAKVKVNARVELPIPEEVLDSRNSDCSQMMYKGSVEILRRADSREGISQYVIRAKTKDTVFHCVVNTLPWACDGKRRYVHAELDDDRGKEVRISLLEDSD